MWSPVAFTDSRVVNRAVEVLRSSTEYSLPATIPHRRLGTMLLTNTLAIHLGIPAMDMTTHLSRRHLLLAGTSDDLLRRPGTIATIPRHPSLGLLENLMTTGFAVPHRRRHRLQLAMILVAITLSLTCRRLATRLDTLHHPRETTTTATREEVLLLEKGIRRTRRLASDMHHTQHLARGRGVPRRGLVMLTWIVSHGMLASCRRL